MAEDSAIVIDCGSYVCRAGFGGTGKVESSLNRNTHSFLDGPRAVIPSNMIGQIGRRFLVDHPIPRGFVENWNDFESVLHHTFQK